MFQFKTMKDEVLVIIKPEENNTYINNFKKIVLDTSPRLSISQLESLCSEKPIIGQALENCFGYEKILSLKRLETLERKHSYKYKEKVWLVAKHISGRYGLGIGFNNNVEIFLEDHGANEDKYFLEVDIYRTDKTNWIKPPQGFLQKTFDLLPLRSQREFKGLLS